MNKMVINHLERLFVTSDASTIVTELEVNHPAAKLLVEAAKAQEAEMGDGTNLVGTDLGRGSFCCLSLLPSSTYNTYNGRGVCNLTGPDFWRRAPEQC
jgi:hypothetical protein